MTTLLRTISDVLKVAVTFSDLRQSSATKNRKQKKFYAGRVKVDFKIPVTHSHTDQ